MRDGVTLLSHTKPHAGATPGPGGVLFSTRPHRCHFRSEARSRAARSGSSFRSRQLRMMPCTEMVKTGDHRGPFRRSKDAEVRLEDSVVA